MRITKVVLALGVLFSAFITTEQATFAASADNIILGEKSVQVKDVQLRLKKLGYYKKKVNEVYDLYTRSEVVKFQETNHIRVDGIVGSQTKGKLHLKTVTKKRNNSERVSASKAEIRLLAKAVYSEARGESFKGQVAVAAVILNRVGVQGFPHTIKGVIYQPRAFTAVSDGQFSLTPDKQAYDAAREALNGVDPTHGAIYYYNPTIASSGWMKQRAVTHKTVRIGHHVFMK